MVAVVYCMPGTIGYWSPATPGIPPGPVVKGGNRGTEACDFPRSHDSGGAGISTPTYLSGVLIEPLPLSALPDQGPVLVLK